MNKKALSRIPLNKLMDLTGLKNNINIETLVVLTGLAAEEIEIIAPKMK